VRSVKVSIASGLSGEELVLGPGNSASLPPP
jgi:hypothetical protein